MYGELLKKSGPGVAKGGTINEGLIFGGIASDNSTKLSSTEEFLCTSNQLLGAGFQCFINTVVFNTE